MASPIKPDDGYESYYTEKIWELIPPIYRHEDGISEKPGVLRVLVEILASQAAVLHRSQNRLWDDIFIDLCDEWAVPYLGDLVGTRLISALDRRGRRIDVAKTIYYRRRKGTLRVLDELIGDISGWDGIVVESFRGLARARHGLDPAPGPLAGRYSGTPPGGWADLRRPFASTLAGGPFDEYAHTPDVRRQYGRDGRWNIPKLVFHLYRLISFPVFGVTPKKRAGGKTFLLDPSGRDVPLFAPRRRLGDWNTWQPPRQWELPAPIPCRLLGDAEYVIGEALILTLKTVLTAAGQPAAAADELEKLRDVRFRSETELRSYIAALPSQAALLFAPVYRALLDGALVSDCGKAALLPAAIEITLVPGPAVPPALTVAGNLSNWLATAPNKSLIVDPERGRFKVLGAAPAGPLSAHYCYGFSGEIGAGPYDRFDGMADITQLPAHIFKTNGGAITAANLPVAGGLQIDDSRTYRPVASKSGLTQLVVQAGNLQRPYLRLGNLWKLTAAAGAGNTLLLDGLWLGGGSNTRVEIAGPWERVKLSHVTLDPGGTNAEGQPVGTVQLVVSGHVQELVIEASITGPITIVAGGLVESLVVRDSIVQSRSTQAAISMAPGRVHLERVTVLGKIAVERLYATETLVLGSVDVADTQSGCFRFSAARAGSRLPHPFASHQFANTGSLLVSQSFGDPHYCQLSEAAPAYLLRGAESGSEIGAFSALNAPIKLDGLRAKVEEYQPVGLIPLFLFET
jgi:hypothetical protein